jgi:hypothetical protein
MSKTQTSPTTQNPTARQLVVVLKNSKYTYEQFKAFNTTVLGLLESADLTGLQPAKTRNVIFFIRTVVRILEVPTNVIPSATYEIARKSLFCMQEQPLQFNYSKANLQKLLNWIDEIVQKKHITIEAMLDQFFALNLHTAIPVN